MGQSGNSRKLKPSMAVKCQGIMKILNIHIFKPSNNRKEGCGHSKSSRDRFLDYYPVILRENNVLLIKIPRHCGWHFATGPHQHEIPVKLEGRRQRWTIAPLKCITAAVGGGDWQQKEIGELSSTPVKTQSFVLLSSLLHIWTFVRTYQIY